ncbi:MAG: TetR/AcrR family transcriptional regulator [Acidimicrobiales bacterium]
MGHKHERGDILAGALATALDGGLAQLSYGRVAKRLGISDRIVVYYFPTKADLATEVLNEVGLQLQVALAPAFAERATDHVALVRAAWPVVATEEADPTFALFFEASGLALAGREPYRELVPALVEGWITWAAEFIEGRPERRRAEATAAVAVLDGLLLLRQLGGAAQAAAAARRILG